jgi:hypothetical protein
MVNKIEKKRERKQQINNNSHDEYIQFKEIKAGNISPGLLYRCSSPLKGGDKKGLIGSLAVKAEINSIINLDDDSSIIEKLSETVPWYHKLVLEKNVICLAMGFTIPGSSFNEKKLKTALQFLITHEGPYLIHCFAGIDRTGFVAALLEALMGASLKEICKGYLSSFSDNHHSLSNPECYRKIKTFIGQLEKMSHGEKINDMNIQTIVEQYLLNDIRLSHEDVMKLKRILSSSKGDYKYECIL